jgi:hypothetical protein
MAGTVHRPLELPDLISLERFIERHVISINGQGFFAILWDVDNNDTKVISLAK